MGVGVGLVQCRCNVEMKDENAENACIDCFDENAINVCMFGMKMEKCVPVQDWCNAGMRNEKCKKSKNGSKNLIFNVFC